MKICSACGDEYTTYKGGRQRCKRCYNARQKAYYHKKVEETGGEWRGRYPRPSATYQTARRYGITIEEVESLRSQGKCEVCDGTEGLSIDHDHETGQVRGLLCRGCNLALGHVGDDVARLGKLIEYLVQKSVQKSGMES